MRPKLGRPSPALIVALAALFAALGGTALAVKNDSVRSKHIKDKQVKTRDLARKAVKKKNIAANAVTAQKVEFFLDSGVQVAEVAESQAAAPEVELLDFNAGYTYGKCFLADGKVQVRVYFAVRGVARGIGGRSFGWAAFSSADDFIEGGAVEGSVTASTPENDRELENDVAAASGESDGAGNEAPWFSVTHDVERPGASAAGEAVVDRYGFAGSTHAMAWKDVGGAASASGLVKEDGCQFQQSATMSE